MSPAVYRRSLPPGWYPENGRQVEDFLKESRVEIESRDGVAAIVPHAGWRFSGALAAEGIGSLAPAASVLLVGGHLHTGAGLQLLPYEVFETPFGDLELDRELAEAVTSELPVSSNPGGDNSVEVQLPLIARFHPDCKVVVLRAAPSEASANLGTVVADWSRRTGREVALIGSTDLTHYGPDYGFVPHGRASEAIDWVREVNDRGFIDAALDLDWRKAIRRAAEDRAACSAGAAAAAMVFAEKRGARAGRLLGYRTSYDIYPGESIVGYAAILFTPEAAIGG